MRGTSGPSVLYLDNAATSFPKAPGVAEIMVRALVEAGGNPGRVVLAPGATDALNQALLGLLRPGDRVVTTSVEHNALARPLSALAGRGVLVDRVACAPDGSLDLDDLRRALQARPTRLVAM